jgi:predicted cupin superfamily sugar epimerase
VASYGRPYISPQKIAAGGLPTPFAQARPAGSALFFMVTPQSPVRLHRIRNDQFYHYYLGDPIEVFLPHDDGRADRIVVGPGIGAGQHVQYLISRQHVPHRAAAWAWPLVSACKPARPGVFPTDVEIGNFDALCKKHPDVAVHIRAIAASAVPVTAAM